MKIERIKINNIPSIIWGEKSCKVFIAIHGNMSNKENIKKCLFLSPVVNMKIIIENMMLWSNTTEKNLKEKQEIKTDFGQTLYWDYYLYVKEHLINTWNNESYILYGNKDNMQDENIIKNFANNFNCKLSVLENGEHYFHTKEQLSYYKNWLDIAVIEGNI